MHTSQQYLAALELLAAGAVIEQISEAPQRFSIRHGRQMALLPASLALQLQAQHKICLRCRLNGRNTYTAT